MATKEVDVSVHIVDWEVVFPKGDYPRGIIKSTFHRVEFPFYSRRSGREIMFFFRMVMRKIGWPMSPGEFNLAQDEIRFSLLPEGDDRAGEEFSFTLASLASFLPPRIFAELQKLAE